MIVQDGFYPFFGVVESISDPEEAGRVQVRCYGYHSENKAFIPTEYLQWFSCVVSNSAGVSGIGESPTQYVNGSTVFGYFLSSDLQDGIVIGSITGKPTHNAFTNLGFNDPDGVYPIYTNESDVNRLARGDNRHWLFNIRAGARVRSVQLPLAGGTWDEPAYKNAAEYPYNSVRETTSGHIKEYDDTPGNERIHEYHRSGTYYEIDSDGNKIVKIVGDGYEIIAGNKFANVRGTVNLTIEGDVNEYVKGNYNRQIDGDMTDVVMGSVKEYYNEQNTEVKGVHSVNATQIKHNEP